MPDDRTATPPLVVPVTPAQLAVIDAFQVAQRLPTRAATVALVVEIALDIIGGDGGRLWDTRSARHR